MKKMLIPTSDAPRNPLVAAARFRLAGSHRRSQASERQRSRRDLLKQLREASTAPQHRKSP